MRERDSLLESSWAGGSDATWISSRKLPPSLLAAPSGEIEGVTCSDVKLCREEFSIQDLIITYYLGSGWASRETLWREMAAAGEKNGDFYSVLGLKKECSDAELRNAYKKLALRWHPDRCSATGRSEFVEEAKEKFQAIQEAYSILSDSNKRFLYDVGVYDSDDDDDDNGMEDFLDEMAQLMSQTNPIEKAQDSFEDLKKLFMGMFESDLDLSGLASGPIPAVTTASASSLGSGYYNAGKDECGGGGKRRGSVLASAAGKAKLEEFDGGSGGFCFGSSDGTQTSGGRGGNRRNGRKQKASSKHGLSSMDAEISA